jgi:hypothetical protein
VFFGLGCLTGLTSSSEELIFKNLISSSIWGIQVEKTFLLSGRGAILKMIRILVEQFVCFPKTPPLRRQVEN